MNVAWCLFALIVRTMHVSLANRFKIASLGGIEAIIKAMSTHIDNSVVQEIACGCLRNLAFNDGIIALNCCCC